MSAGAVFILSSHHISLERSIKKSQVPNNDPFSETGCTTRTERGHTDSRHGDEATDIPVSSNRREAAGCSHSVRAGGGSRALASAAGNCYPRTGRATDPTDCHLASLVGRPYL